MKFLFLIAKNLWRNPLRTVLTALGTMMLVLVVTLVWSVLWFLDQATTQRSENFKAIVTERWSIPSRMPYSYAATLREGAPGRRRFPPVGLDDLAVLCGHRGAFAAEDQPGQHGLRRRDRP